MDGREKVTFQLCSSKERATNANKAKEEKEIQYQKQLAEMERKFREQNLKK